MPQPMSKRPWIALIFVGVAVTKAACIAAAAAPVNHDAYESCRTIADDKARLACFENLVQPQTAPAPAEAAPFGSQTMPHTPEDSTTDSQPVPTSVPIAGKWRLVRTPTPQKGRYVVSIMATAELSGSDADFAGLDLRCENQDFEILAFLIRPLQPGARPAISMNGKTFGGSVVSPGTAILLPSEATVLVKEHWQLLPSASIDIDDDGTKIHGLVSLDGFNTALQTLSDNCSKR